MEIKTQQEADQVRWDILDLKRKIKELEKPLKKYNEETYLENQRERLLHKTFHNMKGAGFIYVVEVSKYEVVGLVFQFFSGDYNLTLKEYGKELSIKTLVSFKHEDFINPGEWKGIGESSFESFSKVAEFLKVCLIDNNKSV